MDQFNDLVSVQMRTMEKLIYLQSEIERCQQVEEQLLALREEAKLEEVRTDIDKMKAELLDIHRQFEEQTDEVIRSYQELSFSAR
ncbi:YgaB family protein [Bacillus massilinigeriensis]|uniref:YgaB family protein n=1 Tax=Bacillus mediterraneensis TaxID=1805474 RepID=UPI0008F9142B|nr:YgaB family protein [Bacillus mediterraneensis]